MKPLSNRIPSTVSSSMPKVLDSSTWITPSLPTTSIALAMTSPISGSPADTVAVWAISSRVSTSLAWSLMASTATSTAFSMPRLRPIGLAPAATLRSPSRTRAWASTVAVVVPSPATSSVFLATSLTSSAPIFSHGSSSSISLAMLTPSFVMVGAPHFFSSTTLRPLGPSVTLTASARTFMPRSSPRRASSSNAIILAMRCGPPYVGRKIQGGRIGARDGRPAGSLPAGPHVPDLWHSPIESASLVFSTRGCRVQAARTQKATNGPAPMIRSRAVRPGQWSDNANAVGLWALLPLGDLELDLLAFLEGPEARRLDGGVVDEDVGLALALGDEAVALLSVEPLHGALCHVRS